MLFVAAFKDAETVALEEIEALHDVDTGAVLDAEEFWLAGAEAEIGDQTVDWPPVTDTWAIEEAGAEVDINCQDVD